MPRKSRPSLSHPAYNRTQYAAGNARPDGENADGLGAIAYCLCVPGVVDGPRLLQYRRAGLGHDIPLKPNGGTQPEKCVQVAMNSMMTARVATLEKYRRSQKATHRLTFMMLESTPRSFLAS